MSEEGAEGWTLSTLKALLDREIRSVEHRIVGEHELTDAKFVTFRTLIDSQAEKVALALSAADKAVNKSEESYDKRFELLNELRSGVATREQLEALEKRLNELATRMDRSEGHGAGAKDNKSGLYLALGALAALMTIVVVVVNILTTK